MNPSQLAVKNAQRLCEKLAMGNKVSPVVAKGWHDYLIPDVEQTLIALNAMAGNGLQADVIRQVREALQQALTSFLTHYPKPEVAFIPDVVAERQITNHELTIADRVTCLPLVPLLYLQPPAKKEGVYYCLDTKTGQVYIAPCLWMNQPCCRQAKIWH